MPNEEFFKEYLRYDKKTGNLIWIKRSRRNNGLIGKVAGCPDKAGYLRFTLKYKGYKVHRVAWLMTYGYWPKNQIDHINGIKSDNRIENLRDVSARENVSNYEIHRAGKLVGSSFCIKSKKYRARITFEGKSILIGRFKTPLLAHKAYLKKKRELNV